MNVLSEVLSAYVFGVTMWFIAAGFAYAFKGFKLAADQ